MSIEKSTYEDYQRRRYWKDHECFCLLTGIDPTLLAEEEDLDNYIEEKDFELWKKIKRIKGKHNYKDGVGFYPFEFIESVQLLDIPVPNALKIVITPKEYGNEYCWEDDMSSNKNDNCTLSPYEYYKKKTLWKRYECVALLNGINPIYCDYENISHVYFTNCWRLEDSINIAVRDGLLETQTKDKENHLNDELEAKAFLSWAKSFNMRIPKPLKEIIGDKTEEINNTVQKNILRPVVGKNDSQNILHVDMENAKLSDELKIALQAWNALYNSDGSFNPKLGHIDNIENWIKENHPKLLQAGIKRIAKVININKKGGATSIN